ncbi:hsp90-like protein [Fistulina hepatica ATCC 64428]|uniref:Hsp90 chaperone protein kinase-targeting subunit n=1 Tax=Fistulina hepatica ATCC 64428 TaxID=1128425 RepID=A0A0D7A8G4_9AGAR|nr:hsp90-like protein [Fistulina hepatica ATCC 64428]
MPLDYSKWDRLELSDDSDIEGHPNVDKRSLIRFKQREIHEQRQARKNRMAVLNHQIDLNGVLLSRLKEVHARLIDESATPSATVYFNNLVEQLDKSPSPERPPNTPDEKLYTYDAQLHSLLSKVASDARTKIHDSSSSSSEREEHLGKALAEEVAGHVKKMGEVIEQDKRDLADLENEAKKHITSEDIHYGFDSGYISKSKPAPVLERTKAKKTEKFTETTIQVLNPKAASSSSAPPVPAPAPEQVVAPDLEDDDDEEGVPEMNASIEQFSHIPLWSFEKSWEFIQAHSDVVVPGAADSLIIAGYRAGNAGKRDYAKQCVHQSLLLQYGEKLGSDGVRVFFNKMKQGDPRARKVFVDDVENTYVQLMGRVDENLRELATEAPGREQIQLVAEKPGQAITFNVPDGPPPEDLRLEGEDAENLDVEEVRRALQMRWDVFSAFPQDLQDALKDGRLETVNEVLGEMDVIVGEAVVNSLARAGILNFAEGGIRDQTGK